MVVDAGVTPLRTRASLETLAQVAAGAAQLPRVPVFDWGDRAASALGLWGPDSATAVAIFGPDGRIIHVGTSTRGAHADLRIALTEQTVRLGEQLRPDTGVRPARADADAEDVFRGAGFPAGVVQIACQDLLSAGRIWVAQWRPASDTPAELDLEAFGASVAWVANAASVIVGDGKSAVRWLTRRETEVLDLIALGSTAREIGEAVCRSVHTVQDHLKAIRRKSGFNTRGALVAAALGRTLPGPGGR